MTTQTPEVRPFAIMRLTHDAIRQGMRDLQAAAGDLGRDAAALSNAQSTLAELRRCIDLHAKQEDECFFGVLNRLFDDVVARAGIPREHEEDVQDVRKVAEKLAGFGAGRASAADVRAVLDHWAKAVEAHLVHEEEIMMPLTEKVAPTMPERAAVVHDILAVDEAEYRAHQLEYVTRQLSRAEAPGKLRMYVAALKAVATPDEYRDYAPLIARSVTAPARAALAQAALI